MTQPTPLVETPRSNIANALQAIVGFWGTTYDVEREAAHDALAVLHTVERRLRAALEQLDTPAGKQKPGLTTHPGSSTVGYQERRQSLGHEE